MVYEALHPTAAEDVTPSNHKLAHNPTGFLVKMFIDWIKRNI